MKSYVIKHFAGTFFFFIILFACAGRLDYRQGLVYVVIALVMLTLNYTVLKVDPELLLERSEPGEGTKQWDKNILGLSFILTITMFIIAGLDSGSFRWSPEFHRILFLLGIILTSSGQLLFLVAQKQNIIRTCLEDKTLKKELKDYPEYALKTRYRLVPYIW